MASRERKNTSDQQFVDIAVIGVGGSGMNALNHMINQQIRGVRFIAMNTDAQVLELTQAQERIVLGKSLTRGLGAGGDASIGTRATLESEQEIRSALESADMLFIAAGMGGGTGTGAAPILASFAQQMGILTVGIVTTPFSFEGSRRRRVAAQGVEELRRYVDALIVIPNDQLLATSSKTTQLTEAFSLADNILAQGVQGIAELITVSGLVNVDFADVHTILQNSGTALMSIGRGKGPSRAQQAATSAMVNPLLHLSLEGARRILFNVTGGEDMTLFEVNEVAELISNSVAGTPDIIFGAVVDPTLHDTIQITLIAAGMQEIQNETIPLPHYESAEIVESVKIPVPSVAQVDSDKKYY
jgi:cell division protein FtsZ